MTSKSLNGKVTVKGQQIMTQVNKLTEWEQEMLLEQQYIAEEMKALQAEFDIPNWSMIDEDDYAMM